MNLSLYFFWKTRYVYIRATWINLYYARPSSRFPKKCRR